MLFRSVLIGLAATAFAMGSSQSPAAKPTKVVVYTAHEDSIINALAPMFEKDTGIKLEYVKMGSGDIIKRAKAEAGNPQADVIWSIGGEQLEAESAILAPYTPKDWNKIADVFKVGTNWLPYTGIMNVFIVNTKMVPANQMPKTWKDLGDPRFRKLVSTARADKSASPRLSQKVRAKHSKPRGARFRIAAAGAWSPLTRVPMGMVLIAAADRAGGRPGSPGPSERGRSSAREALLSSRRRPARRLRPLRPSGAPPPGG